MNLPPGYYLPQVLKHVELFSGCGENKACVSVGMSPRLRKIMCMY